MPRPFTDISVAKINQPIKHGSSVVGVGFTGQYKSLNTHTKTMNNAASIQSKYGYRFYNGTMVYVVGGIDGGSASS